MSQAERPGAPDDVLTGEELLRMPQLEPCELVGGRIRRMTPTNADHGRIELNVAAALRTFVRSRNLGTVMVGEVGIFTHRGPDTVRAADVLFLSNARAGGRSGVGGYLDVAPELVVEVLSPDDRPADVQQKVAEYLAAGVEVVWVVDPASLTVRVHERTGAVSVRAGRDRLDGGRLLPGFELPVSAVFE
jgi:Uma2 family endonuclease